MGYQIVTENVTQTVGPSPNGLQQMGAFISQGGTTIAKNSYSLLTQLSDLTPLLASALAITSITWASNVATVTTAAPHGFTVADTISLVISGATPAGYNGTFTCTVTGASTFTYPLLTNPGLETIPGFYLEADEAELLQMATTFFAQGTNQSVYVLELGAGNPNDGVTALTAWITANPGVFYRYLVPREWDANASFLALIPSFESTTAKVYFHVTTTTGTYTSYTALMKCVFATIEAPSLPNTEFSAAAAFYVLLNYAPSSTNQVTPLAYSYVYGVTPYPTKGNGALLTTLKAAGVNVIGTGAEGGISNTVLWWGTTMDGRPGNYWYAVDWVQIQSQLAIANAIINGSNNPQAPLYYDQNGINQLRKVAQAVMNNGVSFGLILPPVTVTAVAFAVAVAQSPSNYKAGIYTGFAVIFTPQRGFTAITYNIQVTDFPAA